MKHTYTDIHEQKQYKGADAGASGSCLCPSEPAHKHAVSAAGHFRLPKRTPFTRTERERVTVIFGGLTQAHERLFKALLESRGFNVSILPTPTLADYQTGRRYGNNGFCNPLYFTGGSLINFLKSKVADGMSRDEVSASFVFITTRSCGPCRLGLYEQEYRNVLANAGFGGLRVAAFSDTLSLRNGDADEGLPFDIHFYTDLFSAMILGDILNDLANRTRPFECDAGAATAAWEASIAEAEKSFRLRSRARQGLRRLLPAWSVNATAVLNRVFTWPMDLRLLSIILRSRRHFRAVAVDPTRVVPSVKLIGEFWAQTTLGDGNFRAHAFLEAQGAEVVVEPVAVWMLYLLFEAEQNLRLRMHRLRHQRGRSLRSLAVFLLSMLAAAGQIAGLRIAEQLLRLKYNLVRLLFNSVPDALPNMRTFARLAREYYNPALLGGESHMEVAKTLYYTMQKRVHMIVSLKPFGCMPSGMSDGVQPLVRARHPRTLFLSVETSGEGSTNAQSRMLMVLNTARERAVREYQRALSATNSTVTNATGSSSLRAKTLHALSRSASAGTVACRAAAELLSTQRRTPAWKERQS